MKINFFATLRQIVGQKTVEIDMDHGITVRELVNEIISVYPRMRNELLDENGNLYQHVHIFINGRDAPYLDHALETPVYTDDVVNVFPAVGGG